MRQNSATRTYAGLRGVRQSGDWKKIRLILGLGMLLSLAWGAAVWGQADWVKRLDYAFFDALVRLGSGAVEPGRVTLVDVDDQSLSAIGQWPWPRYRLGALLNNLAAAAPSVIGLDILFSEPDRTSLSTLRHSFKREFDLNLELSGLPKGLEDNDAYFGQVLTKTPAVGAVLFLYRLANLETPCRLPPLEIKGETDSLVLPEASGALCNTPMIQAGLERSGFINTTKDWDGALRRLPLLSKYEGGLHPSLTLAVLMLATGATSLEIEKDFFGPKLRLGDFSIPMDNRGCALLRFEGPERSCPSLSAFDALTNNFDPQSLRGRILMLGSSASGLNDLHHTAVSRGMPGPECHAVLINNTFAGKHYREPIWQGAYSLASTLLVGFVVTLLFCLSSPRWAGLGIFCAVLFFPGLSMGGFQAGGLLLPVAGPVLSGCSLLGALSLWLYVKEKRLARLRLEKLALVKQATLESMVAVAETRDMETGGHIKRTQMYVKILAEGLCKNATYRWITPQYIELLYLSAPLHDVGKVAIPDSILCKPGPLTAEEFSRMKEHVRFGKQILDTASQSLAGDDFLELAAEIALTHHEKWDGSGYLQGLAGEDIPLSGRIMALADVYDALLSRRPYKDAMAHATAREIIVKGAGSHFDPALVEVFCREEKQFVEIADSLGAEPQAPFCDARLRNAKDSART